MQTFKPKGLNYKLDRHHPHIMNHIQSAYHNPTSYCVHLTHYVQQVLEAKTHVEKTLTMRALGPTGV